jgi:hypothetical protein
VTKRYDEQTSAGAIEPLRADAMGLRRRLPNFRNSVAHHPEPPATRLQNERVVVPSAAQDPAAPSMSFNWVEVFEKHPKPTHAHSRPVGDSESFEHIEGN